MILQIQKLLNLLFSSGLTEDGILGPKTKEAIKVAQQKLDLIVDGNPSTSLLMKLEEYKTSNSSVASFSNIMKNPKILYYGAAGIGLLMIFLALQKRKSL